MRAVLLSIWTQFLIKIRYLKSVDLEYGVTYEVGDQTVTVTETDPGYSTLDILEFSDICDQDDLDKVLRQARKCWPTMAPFIRLKLEILGSGSSVTLLVPTEIYEAEFYQVL